MDHVTLLSITQVVFSHEMQGANARNVDCQPHQVSSYAVIKSRGMQFGDEMTVPASCWNAAGRLEQWKCIAFSSHPQKGLAGKPSGQVTALF
jgi:hypothetical protein